MTGFDCVFAKEQLHPGKHNNAVMLLAQSKTILNSLNKLDIKEVLFCLHNPIGGRRRLGLNGGHLLLLSFGSV